VAIEVTGSPMMRDFSLAKKGGNWAPPALWPHNKTGEIVHGYVVPLPRLITE
jgi:hypothetical protein